MLMRAAFRLEGPPGFRSHPSMGSLLHGALMERLPAAQAAAWHRPGGPRPYSQHLCWDRERQCSLWRLSALTQEAAQCLVEPLLQETSLELAQKGVRLELALVAQERTSYRQLTETHFLAPRAQRRIHLSFQTPASFRSEGQYMVLPRVEHIWQSLGLKWNAFASAVSLEDGEVLRQIAAHTSIARYRLASASFGLEGVRIPSFQGELELSVRGPDSLARVAALLASYAGFAGIGIKTALGMGGVDLAFVQPGGVRHECGVSDRTGNSPT